MARSIRKTKIFGITNAASEKQDKRRWNRTFRKTCRGLILMHQEAPISIQALTNVWDANKDGRRYRITATKKDMRK